MGGPTRVSFRWLGLLSTSINIMRLVLRLVPLNSHLLRESWREGFDFRCSSEYLRLIYYSESMANTDIHSRFWFMDLLLMEIYS